MVSTHSTVIKNDCDVDTETETSKAAGISLGLTVIFIIVTVLIIITAVAVYIRQLCISLSYAYFLRLIYKHCYRYKSRVKQTVDIEQVSKSYYYTMPGEIIGGVKYWHVEIFAFRRTLAG